MEQPIYTDWQAIVAAIVNRRRQLHLSQKQLAQLTGVSQATISRIEQMDTRVNLEAALKVLRSLGLQLTTA